MVEEESLSQQIRTEIRKETSSQVARAIVAGGIALFMLAATGWLLYFKEQARIILTAGVPDNAVLALDSASDCPDGWIEFTDAAGRVLVGFGAGRNLTFRKYREEGGAETHPLSVAELPSHSHGVIQMVQDNGVDGVDSTTTQSGEMHNQNKFSDPVGANKPHNNMQPYLVLKFCKKLSVW